jgi:hypothetical protein
MAIVAEMVAVEVEAAARAKFLNGSSQCPLEPGGLAELARSSNQNQTRFAGKLVETELRLEDEARLAKKVEVREQSLALDLPAQQSAVDLAACIKRLNVHNV